MHNTSPPISNPAVPGSSPGGRVSSQGLTSLAAYGEGPDSGSSGRCGDPQGTHGGTHGVLAQARRLFGSSFGVSRHPRIRRDSSSGCLIWTGGTGSSGYPKSRVQGRDVQPHRLACALAHPEVDPAGLVARHSCHTPRCCNPIHLSFGTRAENMADALRSANPPAKRSHRQVSALEREEIVRRVRDGESRRAVARSLSRDPRTVRDVLRAAEIREVADA